MDFVWEDPPERKGGDPGVWARRLAPLKEHPNKWADFGPCATTSASHIKKGRVKGVAEGQFDTRTRAMDGDDRPHLFVRYIGDDPSPE